MVYKPKDVFMCVVGEDYTIKVNGVACKMDDRVYAESKDTIEFIPELTVNQAQVFGLVPNEQPRFKVEKGKDNGTD